MYDPSGYSVRDDPCIDKLQLSSGAGSPGTYLPKSRICPSCSGPRSNDSFDTAMFGAERHSFIRGIIIILLFFRIIYELSYNNIYEVVCNDVIFNCDSNYGPQSYGRMCVRVPVGE